MIGLAKWIEIIRLVGPQLKELLPLIMELIKIVREATGATTAPPAYNLLNAPSPEFTTAVNEAVAAGVSEEDAVEMANLVS